MNQLFFYLCRLMNFLKFFLLLNNTSLWYTLAVHFAASSKANIVANSSSRINIQEINDLRLKIVWLWCAKNISMPIKAWPFVCVTLHFQEKKNCIFTMWILHPPKLADLIKQLYALGIATVKHTQTNIFWKKNMGFLAIKERCNIECYHFRASHKYGFPHQNQRKKRKNFGYVLCAIHWA